MSVQRPTLTYQRIELLVWQLWQLRLLLPLKHSFVSSFFAKLCFVGIGLGHRPIFRLEDIRRWQGDRCTDTYNNCHACLQYLLRLPFA